MKRLGTAGLALALAALVSAGAPALAQSPRGWSLEPRVDLVAQERQHRKLRNHGLLGYGGYAYDSFGYYSVSRSRHIGFFAQGGESGVANGRGQFDYDRGYPYDHYAYGEAGDEVAYAAREHWCSTQWVRDGRERVPVRVCRN